MVLPQLPPESGFRFRDKGMRQKSCTSDIGTDRPKAIADPRHALLPVLEQSPPTICRRAHHRLW